MDATRLEILFEQARKLPPEEHAAFLDGIGDADAALREELEALLAAAEGAPEFFGELAEALFPPEQTQRYEPLFHADQRIFHYKMLEKLGVGGMGVVYKAHDTVLDRSVALKFLSPLLSENDEAKVRFIHEAKAASALDHPNIATIHEVGETEDGRLFMAMAYYDGQTLKEKIKEGSLPIPEALDYAIQMAKGLERAHQKQIVHRDIKPANIMLTEDGLIKIVDFGLAKVGEVRLTQSGTTMGTVGYMSPEQSRGEPVDHRTDLWALGAVLYEMLTGQNPFKADYEQAVVYNILNEDPKPITEVRSEVPAELAAVVDKCLMKDRDARYARAADIVADLEALLPTEKEVMPRYVPWVIGGLATLTLAALALWILLPGQRIGVPEEKHLAVLPFSYVGTDSLEQGFCDGLTELLSTQLQQLTTSQSALWVISPREVVARGVETPDQARRVLGANLTVSGVCQRTGDQMRLFLTFEDAEQLRILDSGDITAPLSDRIAFQDGVINRLAAMMETNLGPEARQALAAGSTDVPEAFEAYVQGRAHLERFGQIANVEAAIDLFEIAIQEDSTYALAYAGLGEAYWRKYDSHTKDAQWVVASRRNIERALQLNDRLVEARVFLAVVYRRTGDLEAAHAEVRRILELDPSSDGAYREQARLYRLEGKSEEAERAYLRAIELRRDYWLSYNALGSFYRSQSRYEEALTQYGRVIDVAPGNYFGYNGMGVTYYSMGRLAEASTMWEQAIETRDNYYVPYMNLGTAYLAQRRFLDAARTYEQALGFNSRNYRIWANLSRAYKWIPAEQHKADSTFRRAIELAEAVLASDPDNAGIQLPLAEYYTNVGNNTRARTLLQQGLSGIQQDGDLMFRAALVFEQLGEREDALLWVERALEGGYSLRLIEQDPEMDRLREDARFQRLIEEVEVHLPTSGL